MNSQEYHAHIYFDEPEEKLAEALYEEMVTNFPSARGKMFKKSVGPHRRWNFLFVFSSEIYGELVPWLALNRQGLSVLVHPETGDDLKDHTEHAMWMGKIEKLNLGKFR